MFSDFLESDWLDCGFVNKTMMRCVSIFKHLIGLADLIKLSSVIGNGAIYLIIITFFHILEREPPINFWLSDSFCYTSYIYDTYLHDQIPHVTNLTSYWMPGIAIEWWKGFCYECLCCGKGYITTYATQ